MKTIIIGILSILIITSCETDPTENQPKSCFEINQNDTVVHILESKWILLGFNDNKSGKEECIPGLLREMTITFENNNQLKATSSCNRFDGYYTKSNSDSLLVDSLSTTLIYCTNDTIMKWEEDYFTGLRDAKSYVINGDILTINSSSDYDLVFRFESSNVSIETDCFDFENGEINEKLFEKWYFQGYIDSQNHCKPYNIPEMMIEFSDTDRFEAFGSCNHIEGDFAINDYDSIQTSNVMTTLIYCFNDTIREWEEKYYFGLQNAVKFDIQGIRLILEINNNHRFS